MYDWVPGKLACMEAGNLLDVLPLPDDAVVEPSVVPTAVCMPVLGIWCCQGPRGFGYVDPDLRHSAVHPGIMEHAHFACYRFYMDGQPAAT